MVTGSKCRRRSTLVEKSVESADTLGRDRSLTKQSSCVFNQLPRPRLERVFGRRSALFSGVGGDQMLEERAWVSQMGRNAVTYMVKEFSAGIAAATPVGKTFLAMFEQVLKTDLTGVFFTIQPGAPQTEQEVPRRQL